MLIQYLKKEIQVVKQVEKIYGQADIFLERKACTKKNQLSYDEKVNIITHDINKDTCNYQIHPIDISKYDALKKENIKNIAMIMSSGSDMKQLNEQMIMYFQLVDDCSIIFVPVKQKNDVTPKFIWQLVLDDASKNICKKYISDYAYFKIKSKLIRKICIERPNKFKNAISKVFEDREYEYELLNVDLLNIDEVFSKLAQTIVKTQKRNIVVCLQDFKQVNQFGSIFNDVIMFGKVNNKQQLVIDGKDNEDVVRNLICLLNGKLKKNKNLEFL